MIHKRSWNISILVIFVLLASSLLGILSMNFVQQMIQQSARVFSYYKAYYIAKSWIELWLTQVATHDVGFQYLLTTGHRLIDENFVYGDTYDLAYSISGMAPLLSQNFWQSSGCTTPYRIAGGESMIIPLFRDASAWSLVDIFTQRSYQNLASLFKNKQISFVSEHGWDVVYGMLILSWDQLATNGVFFRKWTLLWWLSDFVDDFDEYLSTIDPFLYPIESQLKQRYDTSWLIDNGFTLYLMISNPSQSALSFCVNIQQSSQRPEVSVLPTASYFLQSIGSYDGQIVALDALYAQPIPGFLFSTYTDY